MAARLQISCPNIGLHSSKKLFYRMTQAITGLYTSYDVIIFPLNNEDDRLMVINTIINVQKLTTTEAQHQSFTARIILYFDVDNFRTIFVQRYLCLNYFLRIIFLHPINTYSSILLAGHCYCQLKS